MAFPSASLTLISPIATLTASLSSIVPKPRASVIEAEPVVHYIAEVDIISLCRLVDKVIVYRYCDCESRSCWWNRQ